MSKALRIIRKAHSVIISGHVNPDGDSLGSMLALGLALERLGKKVYMLCDGAIPPNYRMLPGARQIMHTINKKTDLAIAIDCSVIGLLGENVAAFKKADCILEIDHHEFRKPFGDIGIIDHKATAVGELIYTILKKLGIKINRDIAENILTSIIVETNLFKLHNVTPEVFSICAELLKTGVCFSRLVDMVYGPKTRESMMLTASCLMKARFLKNGRIIWSVITKKDLAMVGGKDYDGDAIASEMNSMKGVKIAVLFREKDKRTWRVSLRSNGDINVGKIAKQYYGGGHFDIAGCYLPNDKRSMRSMLSSVESLI